MDKGAHFHRCDFQVHTPRDINWSGERPVSREDRDEYARRFVAACRDKGLNAVAITDHHDIAFFPYIRRAAAAELDQNGRPVPEHKRLVVFPGMELTLGVPCQALLLLDADFPEHLLPSLYTLLALDPKDAAEATHAETEQLSQLRDLTQLAARLDEQPHLKGHYILLPNVTPEGYQTLHRRGFLSHYKTMPCVGGYLDGGLERLSEGDWNIVNGKVEQYAWKAIGLFPTSDNRRADFEDLGKHTAWVKWVEPTAEALRQACLARETRIAHQEPETPSLVIRALHVSNSAFMGPIDLEFNTQFNCIIGGRGTGKSTILEYLRWALCDQPPILADDEDVPDYQAKRKSLIDKTLKPHNVTVHFDLNEVPHVVRRKSEPPEVLLKVGDAEFKQVREDDIRELLPVQAYSQKQLSAVGVRTEELIRFIEAPVAKDLAKFRGTVDDLKAKIRSSYGLIHRKRQLQQQVDRSEIELDSVTKQIAALKLRLKDLTEPDRDVLARHELFLREAQLLKTWSDETKHLARVFREAQEHLEDRPSAIMEGAQLHDEELMGRIAGEMAGLFADAKAQLTAVTDALANGNERTRAIAEARQLWQAKWEAHEQQYNDVRERAQSQKALLDQIAEAEERAQSLQSDIARLKAEVLSRGTPETEYEAARQEWTGVYRQRGDLLDARCKEMTELSSGTLRATLKRGGRLQQATTSLSALLEGTGIRQQARKVENLERAVSQAEAPVEEWGHLLSELERLAVLSPADEATFTIPDSPTLAAAEFTSQDMEKLARLLSIERWLELSVVELEDEAVFEYQQRETDYISFADASAGQQATALLRVLLNQAGPPLIIDQPEEDLDNEVVLEIVREIWKAKHRRQIVVSSHNANIVVNGDADLVAVCAYRVAGDQSGGRIKAEGAIDVEQVRREIELVMEGGRDAFRLRMDKYGF